MAQQFLDCPQIAACRQQMRGKGMAHRVGRGTGGQTQPQAHPLHRAADQARVQRPAAQAAKQRGVGRHWPGADGQIGLHRLCDRRDHRHHPFLAALAKDAQAGARRRHGRGVAPGQAQSLGNAQPAAIEQCHHGHVAGADPGVGAVFADRFGHRPRGGFVQRAGQGALVARGAGRKYRGGVKAVLALGQPAGEALERRQRPRQRARAAPLGPRGSHPGAHVPGFHGAKLGHARRAAMVMRQKMQKPRQIGPVGVDRVVRGPVQRGDMGQPRRQRIAQRGADRQMAGGLIVWPCARHDNQRRSTRSNTPVKKSTSSVPCPGLKRCGSSAPRASIPGRRPLPRSSRISASDRRSAANSP